MRNAVYFCRDVGVVVGVAVFVLCE